MAASCKSNKSVASTESQREKLPSNIEKALLIEIEAAGGLFGIPVGEGLDKLLNESEQLNEIGENAFGSRGDPVRRKYRRRVNYLRNNWDKAKYLEHLAWLKIDPFETQKRRKSTSKPVSDKVPSKTPSKVPSSVNVPKDEPLEPTPEPEPEPEPSKASANKDKPSKLKPEPLKAPPTAGTKSRASKPEDKRPSIIPSTPIKMSGTFLYPETTGAMHALLTTYTILLLQIISFRLTQVPGNNRSG